VHKRTAPGLARVDDVEGHGEGVRRLGFIDRDHFDVHEDGHVDGFQLAGAPQQRDTPRPKHRRSLAARYEHLE
jgi:hypothetical protein